jgi:hypothetical protein
MLAGMSWRVTSLMKAAESLERKSGRRERAVNMAGFATKADGLAEPEKILKISANKFPHSALSY